MKKLYVLFALCLTGSLFSPSVHADVCSCEMQEEKALFEKASAVFSANSITPMSSTPRKPRRDALSRSSVTFVDDPALRGGGAG